MASEEELRELQRRVLREPDNEEIRSHFEVLLRGYEDHVPFPIYFARWMKAEFPIPLPDNCQPIGSVHSDGLEWVSVTGTPVAAQYPVYMPKDLIEIGGVDLRGTFMTGFWGYGINSHAFYLNIVDEIRRLFFRLPFGGVYMDANEARKRVLHFLESYQQFSEQQIGDTVTHIEGMENMGMGSYLVCFSDGQQKRHEGSLLYGSGFTQLLQP